MEQISILLNLIEYKFSLEDNLLFLNDNFYKSGSFIFFMATEANSVRKELEKIRIAFTKVKNDMETFRGALITIEKNSGFSEKEEQFLLNTIAQLEARVEKLEGKESEELSIFGNTDSMKLHVSNCPYGKKVNQENRAPFETIDEGVKKGYSLCSCLKGQ